METRQALVDVTERYHPDLVAYRRSDVDRQVFHVDLVRSLLEPGARVVDIGGGVSSFSLGCARVGFDAAVVDDFGDSVSATYGDEALRVHRELDVEVISRDVIAEGLGMKPESVDMFATFDSMEHWHNSPKALFAEVMDTLRPGGWFFMGVPNAVNLRKRIAVPLGRAKWSQMSDWYETPVFRGHVREPDVADLHYIARDMGLADVQILGRNWQGHANPSPRVQRATRALDPLLRRRPTLCSDIYLLGRKPVT